MCDENMKKGDSNNNNTSFLPSTAWVATSTTPPLPNGKKYVQVQMLTGERLYLAIDVKCRVKDAFYCCCCHLKIQDPRIFGLAVFVENEYRFLEPNHKLTKYGLKLWKNSSSAWGTDFLGNPTVILYLRVKIYVDFVRMIRCPVSLRHYFMQLRENVKVNWSDCNSIPEPRCWEVASLAIQADYGNYDIDRHRDTYFKPEHYLPRWVINLHDFHYTTNSLTTMHKDLHLMEPLEAMIRYCREVSRSPNSVNMHSYGLRRLKTDIDNNALLGIASRGLELHDTSAGERVLLKSLIWPKIGKLAFERRKFTVAGVGDSKMVFYTSSDEKSRYLLQFCRSVHQNVMALQADIVEARKHEMQESRQFRESYIFTDESDLEWTREHDSFYQRATARVDFWSPSVYGYDQIQYSSGQRVSVVSDASSNTTSGIVSDRLHIHDDSDNDIDSSPILSQLSLSPNVVSNSIEFVNLDSPQSIDDGIGASATSLQSNSNILIGPCHSDKTLTAGSNTDIEEEQTESLVSDIEETVSDRRLSELASKAEEKIAVELNALLTSKNNQKEPIISHIKHNRETSTPKVDIAQLRHTTLNGYQSPRFQIRQLPIFPSPANHSPQVSVTETTSTQTMDLYLDELDDFDIYDKHSTKSLATQTSFYGPSRYKDEDEKNSTKTAAQTQTENTSYRIVSAQKSIGHSPEEQPPKELPSPTVVTVTAPKPHALLQRQNVPERLKLVKQTSSDYTASCDLSALTPLLTTVSSYSHDTQHQSYSLQNLPLTVQSVPDPPGYYEAMCKKYEREKTFGRRTTVSSVDPQVVAQLMTNYNYLTNSDSGLTNQKSVIDSSCQLPSYAASMSQSRQRWSSPPPISPSRTISSSTNQLPMTSSVTNHMPLMSSSINGLDEMVQVRGPPPYGAQPSGIYSKNQTRAVKTQIRGRAGTTIEGQNNRAIGRAQSMPGHSQPQTTWKTKNKHVPPPLTITDHKERTPPTYQTAVQSLAATPETPPIPSTPDGSSGKLNLAQLKSLIQGQNLPFMNALFNDSSLRPQTPIDSPQLRPKPTTDSNLDSVSNYNNRPLSWHESCLPPIESAPVKTSAVRPAPLYYPLPPPSPLIRPPNGNNVTPNETEQGSRFISTPNLAEGLVLDLPPPPPYPSSRCNPPKFGMNPIYSTYTGAYVVGRES